MQRRGIFVFTTEPGADGATVYSRMVGATGSEDPATGSASGPLGCYLVRHGLVPASAAGAIVSAQGVKMGRPSRIHIRLAMSRQRHHARAGRRHQRARRRRPPAVGVAARDRPARRRRAAPHHAARSRGARAAGSWSTGRRSARPERARSILHGRSRSRRRLARARRRADGRPGHRAPSSTSCTCRPP